MPTTQSKTIGTGGDYSDIATWEAAIPANLVTSDEIWQGKLKAEEFAENVLITGHTTDATRYIELTTDTDASVADDDTNDLNYSTSHARITSTSTYFSTGILKTDDNYTRINKIQVLNSGKFSTNTRVAGTNSTIERCIFRSTHSNNYQGLYVQGADSVAYRNLCIAEATGTKEMLYIAPGSGIAYNNTVVNTTAGTQVGGQTDYSRPLYKNNAIFSFKSGNCADARGSGDWDPEADFCATDSSDFSDVTDSSGHLLSLTTSDQFENVSSNFKMKSGADLEAGGTDLTGTVPNDFFGNAFTAGDIGCCAQAAAAGGAYPTSMLLGGVG